MSIWTHQESVTLHWYLRQDQTTVLYSDGIPITAIIVTTSYSLESMTVQMERMFAGIAVVEDNFNNLVVAKHN